MRIRLSEKFDYKVPGKRAFVVYPAGEFTMTHHAGIEAIRLGIGVEVPAPNRDMATKSKPKRAARNAK